MTSSPVVFINQDAMSLKDLFLNEKWELTTVFDRIFAITIKDKKINWLVKTYDKIKYARRECNNLKKLHKLDGVPKVLASSFSKTLNYVIITEASGKDLYDYVKEKGVFSEESVKDIAKQLLIIIKEVHKNKIVHKDIKPENIVYDDVKNKVVLIDFEEKYTEDYRSPEQVMNQNVSYPTDIWSIGATIYYICKKDVPFQNAKEILKKNLKFNKNWSSEFRDFLGCLMEKDIMLRYDAESALNHPWLATL